MASQKIGSYAFIVGIVIAVLAGLVSVYAESMIAGMVGIITLVLVVLGLIVGLLNIKDKHITDFLIATIAVAMVGGSAGGLIGIDQLIPTVGTLLATIVINIVSIVGAAALVVGLKQIMVLAKEQVM
ncbi:MAG: hypothetical protein WC915_03515 [archaeon]|jgi:hypothetical protein